MSVLKLKREYHHQQELIPNTAPWSGEDWSLEGSARFDAAPGALMSNVNAPVTQVAKVKQGTLTHMRWQPNAIRENAGTLAINEATRKDVLFRLTYKLLIATGNVTR
jgi:hypothetical protein